MDASEALAMAREALTQMTQSELATEVGVSEATISRWLSAKSPPQKGLSKLIAWADRAAFRYQPPTSATSQSVREFDSVVATVIATGENRARLGVVQGYAQFVLDQLIELARKQQAVVDGIRPFAEAEGQALAANVPPEKIPELLDSIRRYQAGQEAAAEKGASRRGTG